MRRCGGFHHPQSVEAHRGIAGATEHLGLDDEFRLARVLIDTRSRAGLSQAELAARMKTSQSYIARIEGGQVRPSTAVLERVAQATGTRLRITFEPEGLRAKSPMKTRKAS